MKVLLIEDSVRLRRSLEHGLRKEGCVVDLSGDGCEGLCFAETYTYDVVILDLMLPGIDGLTILQRLRAQGNHTHILILSAKDQVEDRVRGLRLGADDYLVKPFAFDELCARLQALARRPAATQHPCLQLGPLRLDTSLRQISYEGTPIALTRNEYRLLEYLARRRGQVFSHEQLRELLYAHDVEVSSNVIEVMMYNIRKKLRCLGVAPVIRTLRGQGYCVD